MISCTTTTVNLNPGFGGSMMPMGFQPMADARLGGMGMSPMGGMDPMMGMGNPMMGMANPMMGGGDMGYTSLMTQLVGLLAGLLLGGMSGQTSPSTGSSPSGGTSSGGGTSAGAGAGAVDPSQFSGGTDTSRKLAAAAKAEATNGDSNGGLCFRDVSRALKTVGINTSGASAYMAADQLANNPKVKEIKVAKEDLTKLPPGAIVVWDKGPGHPHGHISIAMGDGKEASDLMRNQITNYGTTFRVFMPV